MLANGFTDNGGAIHSASRILDILCNRLCYPGLSRINKYHYYPAAEFTESAWQVHCAGGKVLLEHAAPLRALSGQLMCYKIGQLDLLPTAGVEFNSPSGVHAVPPSRR